MQTSLAAEIPRLVPNEKTAAGECLHDIFSRRAAEFADRIAVSDGKTALSYRELENKSAQIAHGLRQRGVSSGSLVALYMQRSVDAIAALLGILKAGGAYLPIDLGYPEARTDFILNDSKVSLVISEKSCDAKLKFEAGGPDVLYLEDLPRADSASAAGHAATAPASSRELAYVIYTSGSTGQPKGVMVEHANVVRMFEQVQPWFAFDETDIWSMFHSIGFDFSVWEIWGALLHGGQVVVVPYEVSRSPEQFLRLLASTQATILSQTPSAFRGLDLADAAGSESLALRHIVFGGEQLNPGMLDGWMIRHGDEKPVLSNMYGITETTVHVSYKRLRRHEIGSAKESVIGTPIPDLVMHLLDPAGKPVADGEIGELYIEGAGVARGYLHRPELTKERFVSVGKEGARAYRTGDLAWRKSDGDYVYAGRNDQQLKVRGFRIEPGEIEACLQRTGLLSASHIEAYDYGAGDVRLVAYVVPVQQLPAWTETQARQLAAEAANRLPDYMRPSAYISLARLPLTLHGKVDRDALPSPLHGDGTNAAAAATDVSETEASVLRIWGDELGLQGIGLHDDFFDFGGTSLALIRSLALLKERYRVFLDPGVMADGATAEMLAKAVDKKLSETLNGAENSHA